MPLSVRAKGTALVHHFEALETLPNGTLRFVGRKHDPKVGANGGWVPTDQPEQVPDRHEYRHAVKAGDLEAADEATAKLCGVPFVPEVST